MEIISSYTRAEAIEDGVLVDVTNTAKEAGFRFPVAITIGAYEKYIKAPDECPEDFPPQDTAGRLWDTLWMLYRAIRRGAESEVVFEVIFQMPKGNDWEPATERRCKAAGNYARLVKLRALCHPGDHMEPVITIMKMNED